MARYIDVEELYKILNEGNMLETYKDFMAVNRAINDTPTADVVPKSEVDKLELTLQGVMWSVDKWLDEADYDADPIKRAITMREKTLQIVENAKTEVAREIFEEVEKWLATDGTLLIITAKKFAEIKNKYTE